ncbi:Uncharacterised protein [Chlamydia trachomatis]|nr:Uncharacterised protein [Chlamydia trachomatis]
MQGCKITFSTYKTNIVENLCNLIFGKFWICLGNKLFEIIGNQHISFADAVDIIAGDIIPAFRFQESNEGILIL